MAVVALTLLLVTVLVINRLDDYFTNQQRADLDQRAETVAKYVQSRAYEAVGPVDPVVRADGTIDPRVLDTILDPDQQRIIADELAQADVSLTFGWSVPQGEGTSFRAAKGAPLTFPFAANPLPGQTQERSVSVDKKFTNNTSVFAPYVVEVQLANPYTFRATALANVTGLLAAITLFALGLSVLVSAAMARRFTTPLRRLTEASRGLAEGDLTRRVPPDEVRAGSSELAELAVQFNAMADRLQESVEIIRRDRDRSRDFLADVSHELRTPLAALRTFNELLTEGAADDPDARAEFLESSGQQIERLDWLAQNLLELSKLDSGLVLLDLRPDDLRAAVESAVEQSTSAAERRGVRLSLHLPDAPIRIRHDPPRVGQIVANLVANAIKFTPRGGSVAVDVAGTADGARIEVTDTGRRDRSRRDAAHLRALLPRLPGERGAGQRQRARAGHRPLDRRHARRHDRGREPGRRRDALHRGPAARPAARRGNAGRDAGRGRIRRPTIRAAPDGKRAGNFTVRPPAGQPGTGTLRRTTPTSVAHRPTI